MLSGIGEGRRDHEVRIGAGEVRQEPPACPERGQAEKHERPATQESRGAFVAQMGCQCVADNLTIRKRRPQVNGSAAAAAVMVSAIGVPFQLQIRRAASMCKSPDCTDVGSAASQGLDALPELARRNSTLMRSIRTRCENGLRMKSSAPSRNPHNSSISSSLEVRKITGRSECSRRRRSSSIPSMRGILMSRTARSGGLVLNP